MVEKYDFDVAVIGGGPAGMMAAIQATSPEHGRRVVLVEKNSALGKKLLLTGNGRCNLTNLELNSKELVKNYNNGEFLFHAFSVFSPKDTVNFFEKLGLKTKIENSKRVFPESDNAGDVLETLKKYLSNNKVEILFNSEITDIDFKDKKISKLILRDREIIAKSYILCTGGKSYPLTGSAGIGYKLAEKLGHTIIKTKPALSPITMKEKWVKKLQGVSLKDTKISVFQNGKNHFQEEGEILFTHFGLSGPEILNASGKIFDLLEKGEVKMSLDLFPLLNQEELEKRINDTCKQHPNKTVKNILSIFVPERLAEILLDNLSADKNKISNNMSKIERVLIVKTLKNIELTVEDVLGWERAMITRGGVSLKEIDHKTMKSKIISNLFFGGEIIDVDGKTGGFNLQMCWSTGYIAGQSCKHMLQ